MGAIRARRMAEPASPSAAAEVRFASQALREVPASGVGTDVVEGTGTYNLWQDTVTLYPPNLYVGPWTRGWLVGSRLRAEASTNLSLLCAARGP